MNIILEEVNQENLEEVNELLLNESINNEIIDYSNYFIKLQSYGLIIIGLLTLILLTKWLGGK